MRARPRMRMGRVVPIYHCTGRMLEHIPVPGHTWGPMPAALQPCCPIATWAEGSCPLPRSICKASSLVFKVPGMWDSPLYRSPPKPQPVRDAVGCLYWDSRRAPGSSRYRDAAQKWKASVSGVALHVKCCPVITPPARPRADGE